MTTIDGDDDVLVLAADWAGAKAVTTAAPPATASRADVESFMLYLSVVATAAVAAAGVQSLVKRYAPNLMAGALMGFFALVQTAGGAHT